MKRTLMVLIPVLIILQIVSCNKSLRYDSPEINSDEEQPGQQTGAQNNNSIAQDNTEVSNNGSEQNPQQNEITNSHDSSEPKTLREMTAAELISDIRIGWSLGNTLDAHDGPGGFSWLGGGVYANTSVSDLETGWSRPQATLELITSVKNTGFNAVRIPVTWFKVADNNYIIREDWMARVIEVVDYAVANDMFIIINTHHDDSIFKLTDDDMEESKKALTIIWEQIAETFKDYNEKLFFEGLNEPRTIGSPDEWRGGTPEERNNLNILNQVFVDTVRTSGGNNGCRR